MLNTFNINDDDIRKTPSNVTLLVLGTTPNVAPNLSEFSRINFHSPSNHQKTIGFLTISGWIISWLIPLNSHNIKSKILRRSQRLSIVLVQLYQMWTYSTSLNWTISISIISIWKYNCPLGVSYLNHGKQYLTFAILLFLLLNIQNNIYNSYTVS